MSGGSAEPLIFAAEEEKQQYQITMPKVPELWRRALAFEKEITWHLCQWSSDG